MNSKAVKVFVLTALSFITLGAVAVANPQSTSAATTPSYYRGKWHDSFGDMVIIHPSYAYVNNRAMHYKYFKINGYHGSYYHYILRASNEQPVPIGYHHGHLYARIGLGNVKFSK